MPNYEYGKIYEITGTDENGNKITYYGSTSLFYLSQRLATHITNFRNNKNCSSKEVLKCKDYRINLIELYPCKCVEELKSRERFYIDNNICINKHRPIRYEGETKLLVKEYYEQNKQQLNAQKKEYYQKNKEQLKEQAREYFKKNKEQIKEEAKEYRSKHKEQAKEYQKKYYINKIIKKKELELMNNEDINILKFKKLVGKN